jgi:hypothetical protein
MNRQDAEIAKNQKHSQPTDSLGYLVLGALGVLAVRRKG